MTCRDRSCTHWRIEVYLADGRVGVIVPERSFSQAWRLVRLFLGIGRGDLFVRHDSRAAALPSRVS